MMPIIIMIVMTGGIAVVTAVVVAMAIMITPIMMMVSRRTARSYGRAAAGVRSVMIRHPAQQDTSPA